MMNKRIIPKDKQIITKITNKVQNKNIIYADIETIIINKIHHPYAIGWVEEDIFSSIIVHKEEEILNYSVIVKFLEKIKNKNSIIYFHNMSNFDGFLILHKILKLKKIKIILTERNNVIYNININNNLFIRDSNLILKISLKKIGNFFCKTHKKMDYDIAAIELHNIKENEQDILKYLKEDVLTLEEGINTFGQLILEKFDYDIHNSLSLSSIAFNIFRKNFYDVEKHPIYKNTREIDAFIRDGYIGGITEVYKPFLIDGCCYDVNSLYPAMMLQDLPIGKPKFIEDFTDINTDEWIGFAEALIYAPDMDRPILPYKGEWNGDTKIISPTGKWVGTYWNEELINAKKYGYKVVYLKGYEYEKGGVLKKYCETLYNERKKYPKEHPMNLVLKLLLNSLYGRFGMEILKTNKTFVKRTDKKKLDKYRKNYELTEYEVIGEHVYIEYITKSTINKKGLTPKQKLEDFDVNTAVHIAAAITAKARIYMSQFLQDKNVCYTDTDSIYTTKPLEDHLIGGELGQMKLECEIKEAYFIAPKNYNYIKKEGGQEVVFKGNNEKNVDINKINKKIEDNETKYIWPRLSSFRKDFRTFEIKMERTMIENNLDLKKREKVYDEKGKWVDTKPLKINKLFEQIIKEI